MSFIIRVYLKNSSFSEEYAQEKHQGEDSPENIRYEWEDEFKLAGEQVVLERNQTYLLAGERGENDERAGCRNWWRRKWWNHLS